MVLEFQQQQSDQKMKNYPHLYTPVNKKASFSNQLKTHKKTTSFIGTNNQYNKIPSSKTMHPSNNNPLSRRANNTPRISSRSIEEMYVDRSSQDNYDMMERKQLLLQQHRQMNQFYPPPSFGDFGNGHGNHFQADRYSVQSNEDSELFQRSYQKIGQIKYQMHNKNIDHELNEVLELIKEEKMRANQTVKTLKKAADHYKKLCDSVTKTFIDSGMNTQEQLRYFKQVSSSDMGVQQDSQQKMDIRQASPSFAKVHESSQTIASTSRTVESPKRKESQIKEEQIDGKQKQIYLKLATMLEDMNINSKEILPEQIQLNFDIKNYKNLTQTEIIKIQKFFIKKLVQKIPK